VKFVAGSPGFRFYLLYFNTHKAVYGSLGAVIILMLRFYLTGAAILVGGEVNSEIENREFSIRPMYFFASRLVLCVCTGKGSGHESEIDCE
jgi:uncharacterized BrkB/YihY/UPF0761 family membrane protein